jgi:aminopeptidase N
MSTVVGHISGFDTSLARGLCWAAAWDMVRDAEMAARDYVALVCAGLPSEVDINLVTSALRQVQGAITQFADPAWIPAGWQMLADTSKSAIAAAAPGGGFQLAWARAFAGAARTDEDLATLRGWLDGTGVPEGLAIDTELRWSLVATLVAHGRASAADVEAELDRDRTVSGERSAALAHALIPTAESKAETWRRLTGDEKLPNTLQRSLLQGFHHVSQLALTEPYTAKYFEVIDEIWATRDSEPAQEFVSTPTFAGERTMMRQQVARGRGHPPVTSPRRRGQDGAARPRPARTPHRLTPKPRTRTPHPRQRRS